MTVRQRLYQILIALDQLANTLIWWGGESWADETLSARAYREQLLVRHLINGLFFDRDHCFDSYRAERLRSQLPEEYRT